MFDINLTLESLPAGALYALVAVGLLSYIIWVILVNQKEKYRIVQDTKTGYFFIQKQDRGTGLWIGYDVEKDDEVSVSAPAYREYELAAKELEIHLAKKRGDEFVVVATASTTLRGYTFKRKGTIGLPEPK